MNYEAIRLSVERPVSRIVLARPATGNAADLRLVRELADACERLRDEPDVRVVVLVAEGDDFCRGWSGEMVSEGLTIERPGTDPFGPLAGLPQPVIAAIQGACVSAGLEIALACDVRIAAEGASFSQPETEHGLIPLAGGSQRLPRAVGRGRALAMLLTGEVLDAQEAQRAGLVMGVVAREALHREVESLAGRVAARGPIALKYAKEAVHRGLDMTLNQALRYENDLTVILQTTEDRAEGVRAFLEGRRPPQFKGK